MHSGHSGKLTMREQYAHVHTVAQNIDPSVLKCLPVARALTECDTTISFFKIRKQYLNNNMSIFSFITPFDSHSQSQFVRIILELRLHSRGLFQMSCTHLSFHAVE